MLYYLLALVAVFSLGVVDAFFWPALVLAVAIWRQVEQKKVYALAFISGVSVDLLWLQPLGLSAVLLLSYCATCFGLMPRFKSQTKIVIVITLLLESLVFILLRQGIMHF